MINVGGLTLVDKARVIAHEIVRDSTSPLIQSLARLVKTPRGAEKYLLDNFKYNTEEVEYKLFEPTDILKSKIYDCKGDTLFIGAIAKSLGYKVELRIVTNGTSHIYPIIYYPNENKWVALDPVPKPPSYILKHYHTVVLGEVTDNLDDPIKGVVGFSYNPIGIPDTSWKLAIRHPAFTKQQLISDIEKSTKLSGFFKETAQSVTVPSDYIPQVGDVLKFYYYTVKELPLSVEEWIRSKTLSIKNDQFEVLRVYNKNETKQNQSIVQDIESFISSPIVNKNNYIIIEVRIKKSTDLGAFTLAIIAISAVLVAGLGYLTLAKVEKVVKNNPELVSSISVLPYVALIFAGISIIRSLRNE